jgi:hypothetical protein
VKIQKDFHVRKFLEEEIMIKLHFFIAALMSLVCIAACNPIIPVTDRVDILTRSDLCIPSLVTAPYNLSPSNGILANAERVGFSWEFDPTPGCGANGFLLHITESPRSYAIAYWWVEASVNSVEIDPSFMENCSKYYWDVTAVNRTGVANWSEPALIWTDFYGSCGGWGYCDTPGSLEFNYMNFWPYSGQTIWTTNPSLLWDLNDPEGAHCAVDNFHWEVSTTPTFDTTVTSGDTIERSYFPPSGSHYLEDCSLYFWRVTAQSGSNTQVSNIHWFKTDLIEMISTDPHRICGDIRTMCTPSSMPETVSLVSPVEGVTVGKLNPQLVWTYDYSCRPNYFTVVVSESPTLDSPVLNITDYWDYMWTDYFAFSDYLEDCKTYYWQVTAATDLALLPGEPPYAEVLSPIGIFHTDVNGTCSETSGSTKAALRDISVGCITLNTQFAFLDFDQAISGNFEVHIKNETWPCHTESNDPKRLICSGPAVEGGIFANLELWDKHSYQMHLNQQVTTPNCQEEIKPTACPEPVNGCPYQQNGCAFNSNTCQCEYPNGTPCQ